VRIVSGKYKSRQIPVRKNFPSRPTTDFAKEGIFNVIGNYFNLEEAIVLDLFAGTGSISYEFVSRGAAVDAVEIDHRSVQFIHGIINDLQMENIKVIRADVFKILPKLDKKYDIIFADPPYDSDNIPSLPELVFGSGILKPEGWLVLEHSRKLSFRGFEHFKEVRSYGSVNFSIFR